MHSTNYDLEALLRNAEAKATSAGCNWVGVEHVLLVLAESPENLRVTAIVEKIQAAIGERAAVNSEWGTTEATPEFVRLAQLLNFQRQFVPGGQFLSAADIVDAIVQDNPQWSISTLLCQ